MKTSVLAQTHVVLGRIATFVKQHINGYIILLDGNLTRSGSVYSYHTDIDTRNGGVNQNQLWLGAGNNTNELRTSRDIIAGNGTLFSPRAVVVATWYKVEAFDRQAGPQNTCQLTMAYSDVTGET